MSSVKIKDNTKELILKLKKVTETGLMLSAELVEASAKDKAPVDTGRLKASINYTVEPEKALIGTNVEYAEKMEYGGSRQAPKGYLRPALDENRSKIIKIMADSVKELE